MGATWEKPGRMFAIRSWSVSAAGARVGFLGAVTEPHAVRRLLVTLGLAAEPQAVEGELGWETHDAESMPAISGASSPILAFGLDRWARRGVGRSTKTGAGLREQG